MSSAFDQSTYQVRFDWGKAGLDRLASADVVIIVDVLQYSTAMTDAIDAGQTPSAVDPGTWSRDGGTLAQTAASRMPDATVLLGCLRNASATARAVLALQDRRGERTSVAIIAAGDLDGAGALRLAVEDQLGAGAVIAALSDLGIDHTSPEAAAAGESFRGLRRATRHLIGASGSGRELTALQAVRPAEAGDVTPTQAGIVDATEAVPQLEGERFIAFA